MAKILRGYSKDLAEALTYLVAAIAKETNNPTGVLAAIEEVAISPALDESPIVKDLLWQIARNLHGYEPQNGSVNHDGDTPG